MKRNPNTTPKLTPIQQTRIWRLVALLAVLGVCWLLFAPGNGLFSILSERKQLQALQAETEHLVRENAQLQAEVDKMKNNPAYLEDVARRDFGLLKPNERVYDFSRPKDEDKE